MDARIEGHFRISPMLIRFLLEAENRSLRCQIESLRSALDQALAERGQAGKPSPVGRLNASHE